MQLNCLTSFEIEAPPVTINRNFPPTNLWIGLKIVWSQIVL